MAKIIKFYKVKDCYGYMSNFYKHNLFIFNKNYISVEHAYQAQKTFDFDEQELIRLAKTPREARDLGQKVKLRDNWDDLRYDIMWQCVFAKFDQNQDLREKLLSTEYEDLVEDSPVDYYFGCGADGSGKNMLGIILMDVRQKLRVCSN